MHIKVAIVEDQENLRESLATLIDTAEGFQCVGACGTARQALEKIPALKPDVILMDLHLPDAPGAACVRELKARLPQTQILMLTVEEASRSVFAALEAGASGYLVKRHSLAKVLEAVAEVHRGGSPMSSQIARLVVQTFHQRGQAQREEEQLTAREKEILDLVAQGHRSGEIATKLGVSVHTVHAHPHHIHQKLHVRTRSGAVAKYLRK